MSAVPGTSSGLGERLRRRLRTAPAVRLTTAADDGTPDPTPVWFVDVPGGVLLYTPADEDRIELIRRQPEVTVHLDADEGGGRLSLAGRATFPEDCPEPAENPDYLAKYRADMIRVSGDVKLFGAFAATAILVLLDELADG